MATQQVLFRVKGRGEFPTDMLRYDRCWPESSDDAMLMMLDRHDRTVTLRRAFDGTRNAALVHGATRRRWESFGWEVTDIAAGKSPYLGDLS